MWRSFHFTELTRTRFVNRNALFLDYGFTKWSGEPPNSGGVSRATGQMEVGLTLEPRRPHRRSPGPPHGRGHRPLMCGRAGAQPVGPRAPRCRAPLRAPASISSCRSVRDDDRASPPTPRTRPSARATPPSTRAWRASPSTPPAPPPRACKPPSARPHRRRHREGRAPDARPLVTHEPKCYTWAHGSCALSCRVVACLHRCKMALNNDSAVVDTTAV